MFSFLFGRVLRYLVKLSVLTAALVAAEREILGAEPPTHTDRYGDPLPDGAIARLGTARWRHGDFVTSLAYSPDGKTIATSGVGRTLVLWDAATGKEVRVFPGRGSAQGIAFSPDGKSIATTHRMGELWDVATGKLRWERKNVQSVTNAVAFAPDGNTLATAQSDGSVRLWNPANGDETRRIDCEQGYLHTVAYSPDGKLLASGGSDETIRLWDVATGREARRITAASKVIWSVVFSPDGKRLAAIAGDYSLSLWDVATGREIRAFGDKQVLSARPAFSPDGKLLAAGSRDGTFFIWDAASGKEKRRWRVGARRAESLAFSPDGKTLATASFWDGGIRLWDVATGQERNADDAPHGPIPLLRFTADKKTLISAGFDRNVVWWDLTTQTPRRRFAWTTESLKGFALSPDGNTLAVADHNTYEVWLWDIRTGKAAKLPGKHERWVQAIAFSPDGRLVASGAFLDDAIHVWDARQGKEVRQIKGAGFQSCLSLLFSPDGKTLAGAVSRNRRVVQCLWDVASGKERRFLDNQGNGIDLHAFSPDGKVLATSIYDPERQETLVGLLDTTTGRVLCRHGVHRGAIGAVAFSADGKLIVSGGSSDEDNSIHLWEAATGRLIRRFQGHHGCVWGLTFAADGLTVASGAGDSSILLWDITGRQENGKLRLTALTPRQLEQCWTDLANEDAAKGYDAMWALAAAPDQAVPFLRKNLPPAPRPDAKTVARLIADLDSEDFLVRQKAMEELSKFGSAISPALQRALDGKPPLEVRRRLQQLLAQTRDWTPERLRNHRAIQALEHMNTIPARQVLQVLIDGAPGAYRTEEAKTALERSRKQDDD
jgi:WD40 repeat protein